MPTAISALPDRRASKTAKAVCTTMNSVAPCARASSANPACVAASTVTGTRAPASEATAGRGRSVGNSSTSGNPASSARQNAICRAASDSGSDSSPSTARCHNA
ncbi:hypothetical protein IFM12276_55980 [Nocardia sputorum]|uniref:Uncharacterized protein n=1 Tax=Nocardia sputorum TaxID=2984338 RepID=A0ABN6UCI2_9NOCA|nr:hypothetical protein IFM12276_55980 [Nocardia sputorum]